MFLVLRVFLIASPQASSSEDDDSNNGSLFADEVDVYTGDEREDVPAGKMIPSYYAAINS